MPDQVTRFSIFLSSPSEHYDKHSRIAEIAREISDELQDERILLRVISVGTMSPGAGQSAQAVIDRQIGQYDIYIGMMGKKFGTEVDGFGSGTEKEFTAALDLKDANPDNFELFFYFFPTGPISGIDIEQLTKVKDFQAKISSRVFWKEIHETGTFFKDIQKHLTSTVRTWKRRMDAGL